MTKISFEPGPNHQIEVNGRPATEDEIAILTRAHEAQRLQAALSLKITSPVAQSHDDR
jgi:hypothetical protein